MSAQVLAVGSAAGRVLDVVAADSASADSSRPGEKKSVRLVFSGPSCTPRSGVFGWPASSAPLDAQLSGWRAVPPIGQRRYSAMCRVGGPVKGALVPKYGTPWCSSLVKVQGVHSGWHL